MGRVSPRPYRRPGGGRVITLNVLVFIAVIVLALVVGARVAVHVYRVSSLRDVNDAAEVGESL